MYQFRNSYVAHEKETLTDAEKARQTLKVRMRALVAVLGARAVIHARIQTLRAQARYP